MVNDCRVRRTAGNRSQGRERVARIKAIGTRHPALWVLSTSLVLILLAACARPPAQPARVGGVEVGMASWYGPDFHGRRTSSGEIYDMYQLTAAHRELPLGTWIMVANLDNGRSVELRVNDRGPFVPDRIVDVSYEAARLLGMIGPGVIPVRVTITRLAIGERGEALGPAAYIGRTRTVPLRNMGADVWSRRVTMEHRIVYEVQADRIYFLQARYHY